MEIIPRLPRMLTYRIATMLILYALLAFALSSCIVGFIDDEFEKAINEIVPNALEYSKHPHLPHGLWIRFKPPGEVAERPYRELDDIMQFICATDDSGIVAVTYWRLDRQLTLDESGTGSWGIVLGNNKRTKRTEISSNVQLTDLNKPDLKLLPQLKGFWGRSVEILGPVCDLC